MSGRDNDVKGPFILWVNYDAEYEGWSPTSYDEPEEAVDAMRGSLRKWCITEAPLTSSQPLDR
jgi:hypothetical protein